VRLGKIPSFAGIQIVVRQPIFLQEILWLVVPLYRVITDSVAEERFTQRRSAMEQHQSKQLPLREVGAEYRIGSVPMTRDAYEIWTRIPTGQDMKKGPGLAVALSNRITRPMLQSQSTLTPLPKRA